MHGRVSGGLEGPRARRRAVPVRLPAVLAALAVSLLAATAAEAETATRTFFATEEAFLVPPGVTSIHVKAFGGHGGSNARGVSGGRGALIEGQLEVTPGQTLYVHVGGDGVDGKGAGAAGAGGGSSDVRTSPLSAGLSPDPRLIVAAGGGGAGGQPATGIFGPGSGGGNAEEFGATPENLSSTGGESGTQVGGGEGGSGECGTAGGAGQNGALETGGEGGFCASGGLHGGHGGDGYYGGGGGGAGGPPSVTREGAAGGGGGSSLVPPGGSVHLSASSPQVQIRYTQPPNPPAVVTGPATEVIQKAATVNATVNPEDSEVTSCVFEYGETEAYGETAPCSPAPGAGVAPVSVSARLEGLGAASTYHYRIAAGNAHGTGFGADATFTTLLHNPPKVTSINPQTGPAAGGTSVTITGTDLAETTGVSFGSTPATSFTIESDETVTAVAPAHTGLAPVDVQVTTPYGTSPAVGADRFTYVPRPVVQRMKPKLGPEAGGTTVVMEGEHLEGVTAVHFGSAEASSFKLKNGLVEAVSPAGVGTVDVTVTVPVGGTSPIVQGDRFGYQSGPPEYGRCLHAPPGIEDFRGGFSKEGCLTVAQFNPSVYEWDPGVANPGFTASSTKVILQAAVSKAKLTCTSAHEIGTIAAQPNLVQNVVMRFGGCVQAAKKCTTAGHPEGEIETTALEGRLGFENKEKKKVALALYPLGHSGPFLTYTCVGGAPRTLSGGVLALVVVDKMVTSGSVKYAQLEGVQKIQHFEGGGNEVLTNDLGEAVGLALTLTQVDEEPLEINALY
jgi:hypothetical protein